MVKLKNQSVDALRSIFYLTYSSDSTCFFYVVEILYFRSQRVCTTKRADQPGSSVSDSGSSDSVLAVVSSHSASTNVRGLFTPAQTATLPSDQRMHSSCRFSLKKTRRKFRASEN